MKEEYRRGGRQTRRTLQDESEPNDPPRIRASDWKLGLPPGTSHWSLSTDSDVSNEATPARIDHAMITGSFDNVGSTVSGKVGYVSADPNTVDEPIEYDDSGWSASMMEEQKFSEGHYAWQA